MVNAIFRRVQLLFSAGKVLLSGHEKIQARVLDVEVLNNIDRVEPYGFSYRPKDGAQAYLLFPGGDRTYGIAVVIGDKQYNMQLEKGEVALHDDEGNHVHIKRGGEIVATAKTKITLKAPDIVLDGNVLATQAATVTQGLSVLGEGDSGSAITGNFRLIGTITCNGKDISDTHKHPGVQPGDGDTGEVK
ncbi:MAG: phage baseplate assembly protein V [Rhodanobacter sp.]|jgi:phage baseplate assembly protein V|nr:phage baseplate assembly protein V [Rhodanobacter sp.]